MSNLLDAVSSWRDVVSGPHAVVSRQREVPVQVIGGRYELIRKVGAGGMGEVYEGFDRNLKRRIAVKFTHAELGSDPEWSRRFLREARVMATVSHPGMPAIHDAGISEEEPRRPFMVMEFIEGTTFDDLLARRGKLATGVVATLGAQVAAVLAATHRHRIYHRDLKPSNLMLCDNSTVKVLDFGLAVAYDPSYTQITSTGQTLGTPAFMAPEQIEQREVTAQTDLYSLGLILHELLTGKRVFAGGNQFTVWTQQVREAAPDIRDEKPGIPGDLAGLIMCMLEKNPASRPANAESVHAVLMRHTGELGPLIDDERSPARLYALAVGASSPTLDPPVPDFSAVPNAAPVPTDELSRGDLQRAIARARHLADESRYHPAIRALKTVVDKAVPLLGDRDADVVDARVKLADLRFESTDYAAAAALYHTLIDDLTAERGPYDDQVMYCQRRLAESSLHLGNSAEALDRLTRLHLQMETRYGSADRRTVELKELIEKIRG